jgi:hypothetical protein
MPRLTTALGALVAAATLTTAGFVGLNHSEAAAPTQPSRQPAAAAPADTSGGGTSLERAARTRSAEASKPAADAFTDAAPAETDTTPLADTRRVVATTSISCDGILHTVDMDVKIDTLEGFSSQSAAFRSYVWSYSTASGFWTDWTALQAPGGLLTMANLPIENGTNTYAIYMQYSWFDGAQWTDPVGAWSQSYTEKNLFGFTDELVCTA